jgi:hypothetical protein
MQIQKTDHQRHYTRTYMAKRRARLRAQGLCDACGQAPALPPSKKCIACLHKGRKYWRKKRGTRQWKFGKPGRPPLEVRSALTAQKGG